MNGFPVLRGISILLKILAALVLIVGVLGGLLMQSQFGGAMILIWVVSAGYAVGLWAFSELIGVVLAIELNTRQTSESTARALRLAPPVGSPTGSAERSAITGRPESMN
jgi:hypothetical protein